MMIERLKGQLVATVGTGAIIDVNGVGYGVEMPLSTICGLPVVGETVQLWTYTHVREDAIRLYGFATYADRATFEILLSLSGVGPKVAMAIMSTLNLAQIQNAILRQDAAVFEKVPGVGARLSEKILLELKPKLKKLQSALRIDGARAINKVASESPALFDDVATAAGLEAVYDDVRSALENLGFAEKNVTLALKKLRADTALTEFQALMRQALLELSGVTGRGNDVPAAAKSLAPPGQI